MMPSPTSTPVVAVLNSNPEIKTLLQAVFTGEGFRVVSGTTPSARHPMDGLLALFERHDPGVVVYDIPPPYYDNWQIFREFRVVTSPRPRQFVLTTTSPDALDVYRSAGDGLDIVPLPFDLDKLLDTVRRAAARLEEQARALHDTIGRSRDTIDRTHHLLRRVREQGTRQETSAAVPLDEAARRLGVTVAALQGWIDNGLVRAFKLSTGQPAVSLKDVELLRRVQG